MHGESSAREACVDALAAAGTEPAAIPQYEAFDSAAGYDAVTRLISNAVRFSAIFAASDGVALGALAALHDRGFLVPDEVSVVGFGDEAFAPFLRPALTTVRQDFARIGEVAVSMILTALEGERTPDSFTAEPECVIRESTARVADE